MVGSSLLDPSSVTKSQGHCRFQNSPVVASYAPTKQVQAGTGKCKWRAA
jgi:hypothetical protein